MQFGQRLVVSSVSVLDVDMLRMFPQFVLCDLRFDLALTSGILVVPMQTGHGTHSRTTSWPLHLLHSPLGVPAAADVMATRMMAIGVIRFDMLLILSCVLCAVVYHFPVFAF